MKSNDNSGFSLVELMVGMVSSAILALVFSAVLIYGSKGFWRLNREAEMQRDADVAMRTMDRIARAASNATWNVGTSTLTLSLTNGTTQTFSKPTGSSNLLWGTSTLIANRVGLFTNAVTPDGSTVAVDLSLVEGSETFDMKYSIFLRN